MKIIKKNYTNMQEFTIKNFGKMKKRRKNMGKMVI